MPRAARLRVLTDEQSRLVAENMGLACKAARERSRVRPWMEDEVLDGAIDGLINAALAFDASLGLRFSTLGWDAIHHGITGRLRHLGREKRGGLVAICQLDEVAAEDTRLAAEPRLPDDSPDFESLIGPLDQRGRYILRCRYREGLTLQQIGDRLGITREWVNRLQHRAEGQLRESMNATT